MPEFVARASGRPVAWSTHFRGTTGISEGFYVDLSPQFPQLRVVHGGEFRSGMDVNSHALIREARLAAGPAKLRWPRADCVSSRRRRQRELVAALLASGQIAFNQPRRQWPFRTTHRRPQFL